jgi:hypothetical protein
MADLGVFLGLVAELGAADGPTASREAFGWWMVGRAPGKSFGRVLRVMVGGQR